MINDESRRATLADLEIELRGLFEESSRDANADQARMDTRSRSLGRATRLWEVTMLIAMLEDRGDDAAAAARQFKHLSEQHRKARESEADGALDLLEEARRKANLLLVLERTG